MKHAGFIVLGLLLVGLSALFGVLVTSSPLHGPDDTPNGHQDDPSEPGPSSLERVSATGTGHSIDRVPVGEPGNVHGDSLDIEVVDPSRPDLRFTVALVMGEALLDSKVVDERGRATFASLPPDGALLIALWRGCVVGEQAVDGPFQRMQVSAGVDLNVECTIDGLAANEDVWVELEWNPSEPPLAALRELAPADTKIAVQLDGSGAASIEALPINGQGVMQFSKWLQLRNGKTSLSVPGGMRSLTLDLVLPPSIQGRVLGRDLQPAEDALVAYSTVCAQGASEGVFKCGASGRFWIPLTCGDLLGGDLRITGPDGATASIELGTAPQGTSVQLGDLVLGIGRQQEFWVHSPEGDPIEGALLFDDTFKLLDAPASDADGRLVLKHPPHDQPRLNIAAEGYLAASVESSPGMSMRVELAPASVLELCIQDASGTPLGGAGLQITPASPTPYGDRFRDRPDPSQFAFSTQRPRRTVGSMETGRPSWHYTTNPEGCVRLTGLMAGEVLEVLVSDRSGHQQGSPWTVNVAGHGELQREVLRVDAVMRELTAVIVDQNGQPIKDARLRSEGNAGLIVSADSAGRAKLAGVLPAQLDLAFSARGYVTRHLDGVPIPPRGEAAEPLFVALSKGRSIAVTVMTTTGERVDADWAEARLGGQVVGATSKDGRGDITLSDVPFEPVLVVARVGGVEFEASVHHGSDVEIVVPEMGSLAIAFGEDGIPLVEGADGLFLQLVESESGHLLTTYVFRDRLGGELVLENVLPGTYELAWQGVEGVTLPTVEIVSGQQSSIRID